jgi:hypothetical protein
MGDLTYITTTTGITPWGDITGATHIPRDVWEHMNAYYNGELSDEDVRATYMSVLDTYKQPPQAEIEPPQPEEPQGNRIWQEYTATAAEHRDKILFYRMGDFYEVMGSDANAVAKFLNLTITGRDVGLAERVPMVGVPAHSLDGYVERLTSEGFGVVVSRNLNDLSIHEGKPQLSILEDAPEQDTAADYALSYRFLSDPDRIIVFNDIDPDEIDIVGRVHADGEVVITIENVPQSVIDELTEYATENFDGLKESAEARSQRMFDFALEQAHAFDEALGINQPPQANEVPAVQTTTPTTEIAAFVQSKLETGEKFTSAELFATATQAYGDTMANNAFTSKDAYDAMELGVNQYMLSMDSISHENVMNALDLLPTQTRRTAEMEKF